MINVCIYYQSCPILSGKIQLKEAVLNDYKKTYCNDGKEAWGLCKRYQVREIFGKCPLVILPDFPLSAEEIIEKYDL